jgi:hypothetical protein
MQQRDSKRSQERNTGGGRQTEGVVEKSESESL